MYSKVKNLLYNPACFRVDQKMTFFVRVFYIAQRCIGSIVCAICEPCPHGRLYLFAGLAGVHFIQNVEEWGKLILSVDGVHIVIDSDIADAFAGKVDFRVLAGQNVVFCLSGINPS